MKTIEDKLLAAELWKAHQALCSAIGKIRCETSEAILSEVAKHPNHLVGKSMEMRGQVAFARKKHLKYDVERRTRLSLNRYVSRYLGVDLPDHQVQQFCNKVCNTLWGFDASCVNVLTDADEIVDFYEDTGDDMIGSCMSHQKCRDWIRNVYGDNDNVRLLTVGDSDHQRGRAVLWKADCGTLLCDRIYPNDPGKDEHQQILAKAREMGATIRMHHGAPENREFMAPYTITLKCYDPDMGIPYMDSFYKTECVTDCKLVLSNKGGYITLHDYENGNIENLCCESCGDSIDPDDHYHSPDCEDLCEYCYDRDYVCCEDCGETVSREGCYVTHDGLTICESCRDDYTFCEDCNELFPTDEITATENNRYVCESCLSASYTECEKCGDHIPDDELVEADGDQLCEHCRDLHYTECDDCGEWVPNDDITGSVCDECEAKKEEQEEEEHELAVA